MAYEVEIKAHIDSDEYAQLKKHLSNTMKDIGFAEMHDIYFKKLGQSEEVLRLRECSLRGTILTYKERHIFDAVEMNKELELTVSDLDKAQKMLEALGFVVSFEKQKVVHRFENSELCVELAEVAGLGLFVEIEQIVEDEHDIQAVEQAKITVKEFLINLGIKSEQIEEQSYKKLMGYI